MSSNSQHESLILDSGSQRLIDLTNPSVERTSEAVEEILSILQRKAPKLLDCLADSNKVNLAKQCHLKMYSRNDVVFLQGDEPDAYYVVIRGAVSIYALDTNAVKSQDCKDLAANEKGRNCYGVFLLQLLSGECFGELSFNENGVHSCRNASVVSDGCHGQARITNSSSVIPGREASDLCILLLVDAAVYMSEMFSRHSSKHQTKNKISLLKESSLFKHWSITQLVKMAYAMKKKQYGKGNEIIRQGERMEYVWMIKEGAVRISHIVNTNKGGKHSTRKNIPMLVDETATSESRLVVDIADLGRNDCIGLVESVDENVKKSQREVVALCQTELFFLP